MASELLNKLANLPNALTQTVANGTSRAAKRAPRDVLNAANKKAKALLKADRPGGGYVEGDTVDRVMAYARPTAAGYVVGANLGHLYEQSAKYLFGRGLRTNDSPHQARRSFVEGAGVETRANFENPSNPTSTPEQRAARFAGNINALKQEGAFGLLIKTAASHAGSLIGTALYDDKAKIEALKSKFVTGANVTNAGLRTLLVSVPTVAAVTTGVAVGAGVSGLLAACALTKAGLEKGAGAIGQWRAARAEAQAKAKAAQGEAGAGKEPTKTKAEKKPAKVKTKPATPASAAKTARPTPPPSTTSQGVGSGSAGKRKTAATSASGTSSASTRFASPGATSSTGSGASFASATSKTPPPSPVKASGPAGNRGARAGRAAVAASMALISAKRHQASFPAESVAADRQAALPRLHDLASVVERNVTNLRELDPDYGRLADLEEGLTGLKAFIAHHEAGLPRPQAPKSGKSDSAASAAFESAQQQPASRSQTSASTPAGDAAAAAAATPVGPAQKSAVLDGLHAEVSALVESSGQEGNILDFEDVAALRTRLKAARSLTAGSPALQAVFNALMSALRGLDDVEN